MKRCSETILFSADDPWHSVFLQCEKQEGHNGKHRCEKTEDKHGHKVKLSWSTNNYDEFGNEHW